MLRCVQGNGATFSFMRETPLNVHTPFSPVFDADLLCIPWDWQDNYLPGTWLSMAIKSLEYTFIPSILISLLGNWIIISLQYPFAFTLWCQSGYHCISSNRNFGFISSTFVSSWSSLKAQDMSRTIFFLSPVSKIIQNYILALNCLSMPFGAWLCE